MSEQRTTRHRAWMASNPLQYLRQLLSPRGRSDALMAELVERSRMLVAGIDNQSRDINQKLAEIVLGISNQSTAFNEKLTQLVHGIKNQSRGSITAPFVRSTSQAKAPEARHKQALLSEPEIAAVRTRWLGSGTDAVAKYDNALDGIEPWTGPVPEGFVVDFLGVLTSLKFTRIAGADFVGAPADSDRHVHATIPRMSAARNEADAETWFEAVDWVVAAREARDSYVMITLGAHYGAQAVGACRALQAINPLPYQLVAVEPVPPNVAWLEEHMRNNRIDPAEQWIIPLAISDRADPVYFPIGAPGIGANNCVATDELEARKKYADQFINAGQAEDALRNLLMRNTTGLTQDLVPGQNVEIQLVSAITLKEVLAPFHFVDFLEADIQQSEILVFPPFLDLLRRKVRRIHIGTHGGSVHWTLHKLFEDAGWDIIFSYEPNATHQSAVGRFVINDGVLTVRNPDL